MNAPQLESQRQQAEAWNMVFCALSRSLPNGFLRLQVPDNADASGAERAVYAIELMALDRLELRANLKHAAHWFDQLKYEDAQGYQAAIDTSVGRLG